jgi:hypothetical protein
VLDLRANRWTSSVTEKPVKPGAGGRGGAPQQQHKPAPAPAGTAFPPPISHTAASGELVRSPDSLTSMDVYQAVAVPRIARLALADPRTALTEARAVMPKDGRR